MCLFRQLESGRAVDISVKLGKPSPGVVKVFLFFAEIKNIGNFGCFCRMIRYVITCIPQGGRL